MTVLAMKVADPGDVLLTTPALHMLHHATGSVDALVRPHCASVIQGAPFIRRIVTTDQAVYLNPLTWNDARRRRADLAALVTLKRRRYEGMVIMHHLTTWQGTARWALLSAVLAIPLRVGLDNGRGRFLSHRVADRGFGTLHEADYWNLLARTYINTRPGSHDTPLSELWLPAASEDQTWARAWHKAVFDTAPFIVIHPGSGRYIEARRWPIGNYAATITRLVRKGYRVVVVGTAYEHTLAQECGVGKIAGVQSLVGATSIGQLAAVMARASGFIGNDSFPMHLAAAANIPLVAIFGPTNAAAWRPWPLDRPWFHVLVKQPWCQPCIYRGHQLGRRQGCLTRPCLTGTTPVDVAKALDQAIGAKTQAPNDNHIDH